MLKCRVINCNWTVALIFPKDKNDNWLRGEVYAYLWVVGWRGELDMNPCRAIFPAQPRILFQLLMRANQRAWAEYPQENHLNPKKTFHINLMCSFSGSHFSPMLFFSRLFVFGIREKAARPASIFFLTKRWGYFPFRLRASLTIEEEKSTSIDDRRKEERKRG